ncbi:guanylate-binding protein [Glomus cerebriforme]|uniref:Guanylate-binding protein n=1 Tax=Glomus cerebriforme TaxID=658196 RepID=A0A397TK27_9GLOM|nr:guanylate-binding protein [Glomus cerebriforme]
MTQYLSDQLSSNEKSDNGKTGNKFGRGIEFREGAPIQLLKYSEKSENGKFGQIVLNSEALNIFREICEPLAIISVVGSFRRGKSWFANVLHGRHDGFDLGAKVEGCTRGIYMWSPPFKLTSKQSDGKIIQKRVIVLDSEGIDDPVQDENWATKLFILCLVISSTFIYNINGIVGRDDIGKLHLMTDLSKFIQEPEGGDFLPRLVILLRDFNLENPGNFKDYFLKQMNNINSKGE